MSSSPTTALAGPAATMSIPGYRIERRIGTGGMAMVYLATQESLQRPVALKVLNPLHSDTPEFTERFLNEGRMLASLAHGNIIIIHDIGVAGAVHYIAMEYVEGGDLKQRMRKGITIPEALGYTETVARALHYAHEKGIIHRDVKPANVMFRSDGTLVLTDFGIAKQLDADSDLTISGSTIGSPHYLSPEQARNNKVDARADIYSIGIMLFEMLTGSKPYRGDSDIETVLKHLTDPPPRLPDSLRRLQPLLDQMLAKKAEQRIGSAALVADALRGARETWSGPVDVEPLEFPLPSSTRPAPEAVATPEPAPAPENLPVTVDQDAATAVDTLSGGSSGRWLKLALAGAGLSVVALLAVLLAGRNWLDAYIRDAVAPSAQTTQTTAPELPIPAAPDDVGPVTAAALSPPAHPGSGAGAADGEPAAPAAATPAAVETAAPVEAPARRTADEEAQITRLLESAERAMDEFRLTRPVGNSAADYIEQVLRIDPGNQAARDSFKRIAGRYVMLARSAIDKGSLDKAQLYVGRGRQVDASNSDLAALDREIHAARARRSADRPARTKSVSPVNDSAALTEEGASLSEPTAHQGETPTELFNRIKGFFDKD